jgi:hypothetical protein
MERCDKCGRELPSNQLILTEQDGKWFGICPPCQSVMGMCPTCDKKRVCSFEDATINIPPTVVQEFRQGNTIIRQQVKNPDRIRETCQKGCDCFSEEFGCLRQISQTCGNYKEERINERV